VPLRNYTLTHSLAIDHLVPYCHLDQAHNDDLLCKECKKKENTSNTILKTRKIKANTCKPITQHI